MFLILLDSFLRLFLSLVWCSYSTMVLLHFEFAKENYCSWKLSSLTERAGRKCKSEGWQRSRNRSFLICVRMLWDCLAVLQCWEGMSEHEELSGLNDSCSLSFWGVCWHHRLHSALGYAAIIRDCWQGQGTSSKWFITMSVLPCFYWTHVRVSWKTNL